MKAPQRTCNNTSFIAEISMVGGDTTILESNDNAITIDGACSTCENVHESTTAGDVRANVSTAKEDERGERTGDGGSWLERGGDGLKEKERLLTTSIGEGGEGVDGATEERGGKGVDKRQRRRRVS
ncbi:hypothetical protein Syun_008528 [Stephania yunnanensis]|uniref:Uncharacterized protein n=1 Tax=Stephania yunnanensis TaxID=152371 RepID=A0AAP0PPQ8_9MAGN